MAEAATRRELPHVTAILRDAGLVSVEWFTDEARDRGTAVHLAARYYDEGDLDLGSVDPTVAPRLAQYRRFLEEARPKIEAIELPVRNEAVGYCGTLDRLIDLSGRLAVLDLKGPTQSEWHGVQLAAYAACIGGPVARFNLYLSDESYRLVERRNRLDWECFKAAVTLASWRSSCRKNGS